MDRADGLEACHSRTGVSARARRTGEPVVRLNVESRGDAADGRSERTLLAAGQWRV